MQDTGGYGKIFFPCILIHRKPMALSIGFKLFLIVFFVSSHGFTKGEKAVPTGLDIMEITSVSIKLNWTEIEGETYIIKVTTNQNDKIKDCFDGKENVTSPFTVTELCDGTRSSCFEGKLQPRTKYDIGLCAGSIPSDPQLSNQTSMSKPNSFNAIETGPLPPTNVTASSNKTDEIFVEWDDDDTSTTQPVIQYTVYYRPTDNRIGERNKTTKNRTKQLTITDLQANTEYKIDVESITNNTKSGKGSGRSFATTATTDLHAVTNLCVAQSSTNPCCELELTWTTPQADGDSIEIQYNSTTMNEVNFTAVPFANTSCTLVVQPGNNYTVSMVTKSGNMTSQPVTMEANTKPYQVDVNMTPQSSAIALEWEPPSGYAEWIMIEYEINNAWLRARLPSSNTSYVIKGADSNTKYSVVVYTTITNIDGKIEESDKSQYNPNTLKEPVPIPLTLILGLVAGFVAAFSVITITVICFYYRRKQPAKSKEIKTTDQFESVVETPEASTNDSNSRKINLKEFGDYMKSMTPLMFAKEFQELVSVGQEQSTSAGLGINAPKNRYTNILPYDDTRVALSSISGRDYINASFVPGKKHNKEYIATQGPLPNTRDDFWRMVSQQNCRVIVMLVECGEQVCDHYWPSDNMAIEVGNMTITLSSQSVKNNWTTREIILRKGGKTRIITHFQTTSWPDNGTLYTTEYLGLFAREVRTFRDAQSRSGPMIVHCSDGSSRTGTFIAIDRLLQEIEDNTFVDIFGIVHELKTHRINMVATQLQYVLLYQIVKDAVSNAHNVYVEQGPVYVNYSTPPAQEDYRNPAYLYDSKI